MTKLLIVNADDLAADEDRNAGIFEAIEEGVVTSVSVLANGPALEDAANRIRSLKKRRLSVGLHFNLSQGDPLVPDHRILVGPDGRFLGKEAAHQLLRRTSSPDLEREIGRELAAQTAKLQQAGIAIDHIDGHQHVHVFPAAANATMRAAAGNGIRWVRVPLELAPAEPQPRDTAEEAMMFSSLAAAVRHLAHENGLFTADHFRGLYFKGRLPASRWEEFLNSLPEGVSELMVHPGRAASNDSGPFSSFSTPAREQELKALTDGRFHRALEKTGVDLAIFPERQCAS